MTPSGSAQTVIETGDNVYQICFTDPNQGVASADYIAENALATKIGVIYDSSDAYSSGIYAKFKTEAESKSLEIVTAEAFTSDNKERPVHPGCQSARKLALSWCSCPSTTPRLLRS